MKNTISLLIAGVSLLILASCDKKAPEITINSPSESTYVMEDMKAEVSFNVNVEDNKQLHEVQLELKNTTDDKVVFHKHVHVDAPSFSYDTTIIFEESHKDHIFEVTATDHKENSNVASAAFHIHMM